MSHILSHKEPEPAVIMPFLGLHHRICPSTNQTGPTIIPICPSESLGWKHLASWCQRLTADLWRSARQPSDCTARESHWALRWSPQYSSPSYRNQGLDCWSKWKYSGDHQPSACNPVCALFLGQGERLTVNFFPFYLPHHFSSSSTGINTRVKVVAATALIPSIMTKIRDTSTGEGGIQEWTPFIMDLG